jgi:hypothetical protein
MSGCAPALALPAIGGPEYVVTGGDVEVVVEPELPQPANAAARTVADTAVTAAVPGCRRMVVLQLLRIAPLRWKETGMCGRWFKGA